MLGANLRNGQAGPLGTTRAAKLGAMLEATGTSIAGTLLGAMLGAGGKALTGRLLSIWRSGVLAVLAFWPTWRDLQSGFRAGADLAGAVLARVWPFWRPPRSGDRPVRTARNDPNMTQIDTKLIPT